MSILYLLDIKPKTFSQQWENVKKKKKKKEKFKRGKI